MVKSEGSRIGRTACHATIALLLLCVVNFGMGASARAQDADRSVDAQLYRISVGDALSVTFPYNPELNHAGPIGPDGRFSMPIAGNLALGGRTIDDAAALISAALRSEGVVENAHPTVAIQTYGAVVYVGGEVRTPGAVKLTGLLDPLQAVITAGGLLDTAKSKRIVIIHRNPDGTIDQRYADLRAYSHKGIGTGIGLQSQDIIFVPRSSIAEADLWIDQHINKLLPFSRSLNYNLGNNAVVSR